jgi:hypothetical protein
MFNIYFYTITYYLFYLNIATAFAPVSRVSRSSLKMSFENAEGAQPPLGFFDPLGLLDGATEDRFFQLRFVELKHGRIAMLGVLGYLVQENSRFPGFIDLEGHKFSDLPNGFAGLAAVPALGLAQIILSIGWWELKGWKQVVGSTPGDFGIAYLKDYNTEAKKADIRAKELNNGRAAQMGLLALMVHENLGDGNPFVLGFPAHH